MYGSLRHSRQWLLVSGERRFLSFCGVHARIPEPDKRCGSIWRQYAQQVRFKTNRSQKPPFMIKYVGLTGSARPSQAYDGAELSRRIEPKYQRCHDLPGIVTNPGAHQHIDPDLTAGCKI